jgi:hypothetical protein
MTKESKQLEFSSPSQSVFEQFRPALAKFVEIHRDQLNQQVSFVLTIAMCKSKGENVILLSAENPDKFFVKDDFKGILFLHFTLFLDKFVSKKRDQKLKKIFFFTL